MSVREYWIYQKRNVHVPWAMLITKTYDRRDRNETIIDWTVYHEDIPTQTRSKSFIGLQFPTAEGYADAICSELEDIVTVSELDHAQILREIERILV